MKKLNKQDWEDKLEEIVLAIYRQGAKDGEILKSGRTISVGSIDTWVNTISAKLYKAQSEAKEELVKEIKEWLWKHQIKGMYYIEDFIDYLEKLNIKK